MTSWLLREKAYDESSVFRPENLLREARRQNQVEDGSVPAVCALDVEALIAAVVFSYPFADSRYGFPRAVSGRRMGGFRM